MQLLVDSTFKNTCAETLAVNGIFCNFAEQLQWRATKQAIMRFGQMPENELSKFLLFFIFHTQKSLKECI